MTTENQTPTQVSQGLRELAIKENARLEQESREALAELGYAEFFKVPEGTTNLELIDQPPRVNDKYEGRLIFRILADGREYDWSINTHSPLYRDVMALVSRGTMKICVLRVGQGMDTRYSVKPWA